MWATMRVCSIAADDVSIGGSAWTPVDNSATTTTDGESLSKYEAARIISAWLNSTFGMIPYIGYRAETEGAYGEWKMGQARRATALDPSKLTDSQAQAMLDAYEEVRDSEWGLLHGQLETVQNDKSHPRAELDKAVAEALLLLEVEDSDSADGDLDVEDVIDFDSLYEDLENTIRLLGNVMA